MACELEESLIQQQPQELQSLVNEIRSDIIRVSRADVHNQRSMWTFSVKSKCSNLCTFMERMWGQVSVRRFLSSTATNS
jgi:hypothetical protein